MARHPLPLHRLVVRVHRRNARIPHEPPIVRFLVRIPDGVRKRLDDWRFWVIIYGVALGALVVGMYFINTRTSKTLANQAAAAAQVAAEKQATVLTDYRACVASIPQLTHVNEFVHGVQDLHETLLENSLANHVATPPGTAVYRQQIKNIAKLRLNVEAVSGVEFPVPTVKQCRAQRDAAGGRK